MEPAARGRLVFVAWIAWAVAVLAAYYVQISRAVVHGRAPGGEQLLAACLPVGLALAAAVAIRVGAACRSRLPHLQAPASRLSVALALAGVAALPWFLVHPRLSAVLAGVSAPGLPWFGEAAARSLVAVAGATLVVAAAVGGGLWVLHFLKWRGSTRPEHLVFAAATGVGPIAAGSLLLASLGLYSPASAAVLVAALAIAGAFAPSPGNPPPVLPAQESSFSPGWWGITAAALTYALVAALAPEKEYDALWYHLYLPRLWLEAGHPVDVVEEYVSLYPLTWELVFSAGLVLGGSVGAKLLHFLCLPALAAIVARAARDFFPGAPAGAAVALVVTTPTLMWEASTAYVDLALAMHAALGCYALARTEGRGGPWAAVAAVQLGLAAATKHLGVCITVIALAMFGLAAVRAGRGVLPTLRTALLLALLAAAIPSPWYLRGWAASGNPVFPEMVGIFGASPPDRWDAHAERGLASFKARFGHGRSLRDLASLPWNVTVHGAAFGGALGPLFLILVPALLVSRRRGPAAAWLGAGTLAYVLLWASPISSFQMRFLMPVVPPLALLAAAGLGAARFAPGVPGFARRAATAAAMSLAALNLPPFISLHEADRLGWQGWLTHVIRDSPAAVVAGRESEQAYLRREVPSFAAWRAIDRLPGNVRVLTFSGGDHFYSHRPRLAHDATRARPAVWGADRAQAPQAVAALRRLGITHVLFDRRQMQDREALALALASFEVQQACERQFDDGRYWLCRLEYDRMATLAGYPGR